jgi:hypothetical protein
MIDLKVHDESFLVLTKEGYAVAEEGSPEAKLWATLTAEEGKTAAELTVRFHQGSAESISS